MKIKLGHRYVDGYGEIVTIVMDNGSSQWPFKGNNGRTYREDGVFGSSPGSPFNLEYELKDEGAQPKSSPLWWLVGIPLIMGLTWLSFNFEKIVLLIEKFN